MTRATDYTNEAQQRLLKLLFALFGDVVNGYPPAALAKALGASPSVITRDLDNLRTAGVADRDEATGHWRLTPRLPQQAIKVFNAIDTAQRRVDEARNIKVFNAIDTAQRRVDEARNRFTRNPD